MTQPFALPPWLTISTDAVTIEVVARPGASRSGFHRIAPQGLVIGVATAPEKGKANVELIAFLAKSLAVPRSSIRILRGEASRHKSIRIVVSEPAKVAQHLVGLVGGDERNKGEETASR